MVVSPHNNRFELFSKYIRQLLMESLGKEFDLSGKLVNQGIEVCANHLSAYQYAYMQQLRDCISNLLVETIQVLKEREGKIRFVEPGITAGDFLSGFFFGTREALYESGIQSVTLTVSDVSAFSIEVLIALLERAVAFYASVININAYDQPGVEAGNKAAELILAIQLRILDFLHTNSGRSICLIEITRAASPDRQEEIFQICQYLSSNSDRRIHAEMGESPFDNQYRML